jgi:hypothetical protein
MKISPTPCSFVVAIYTAFTAELELRWIGMAALGTRFLQLGTASPAKLHSLGILELTFQALQFKALRMGLGGREVGQSDAFSPPQFPQRSFTL